MDYSGLMPNRSDLRHALYTLYSATGFRDLSWYQRRLMETALRIQHRFDKQIAEHKKGISYKYHKSHEFLTGINCHRSAYCVEQEISFKSMPSYIPDSFFTSDCPEFHCNLYLQALVTVLYNSTPCIVHINNRRNDFTPTHTFIALGWSSRIFDIVTWEKIGNIYPYRVAGLKQIYNEYPGRYWIARPLQTPR